MRRRDVLKAAACAVAAPWLLRPGRAEASAAPFLKGFNAYYLHEELYRRSEAQGFQRLAATARDYLRRELDLPGLMRDCAFNSVRFWAFNHYPCCAGPNRPASRACTVRAPGEPNQAALEVLAALLDGLDDLGLRQVPVLSNYWLSYGGVVAVLEWAGRLPRGAFEKAFCGLGETGGNELLRERSLEFFSAPEVVSAWRSAVRPVLGVLAGRANLAVVELMNEPRGLHPQGSDPAKARASVAAWLKGQGEFVRQALRLPAPLSSGEEGWLADGLPGTPPALKPGGEPWEGVDMLQNVRQGGMDAASVHCYLHPEASRTFANICDVMHTDKRGWEFLLAAPATPEAVAKAGAEWIALRGKACGQTPWYLGEFGWTRPGPDGQPLVGEAVREERARIYASWIEAARSNGAFGAFVWMPDGPEHKDTFYGLGREDLKRCFAS